MFKYKKKSTSVLNRKSSILSFKFISSIVSCIVYTIIFCKYGKKFILNGSANCSERFVLRQLIRMPFYFHIPFFILFLIFNFCCFFSSFKTFLDSSEESKIRYLYRWKYGIFSFQRDFIKFFETLVSFEHNTRNGYEL